jgi:hypothetical protein
MHGTVHGRWRVIAAVGLACLMADAPVYALDKKHYQIDFGLPDSANGAARIEVRIEALMPFVACGKEPEFFGYLSLQLADETYQPGEGLAESVVAKAEWLRRVRARAAGHAATVPATCVAKYSFYFEPNKQREARTRGIRLLTDGGNPYARFGSECDHATTTVSIDGNFVTAQSAVPEACVRKQVNMAIDEWRNNEQLGTDKLPCQFGLGGTTKGDYDVVVRDLMRVFFIDRDAGGAILNVSARDRLRDQLLSVSGAPLATESYSLFECGNTEKSQGTPEDIAAEQGDHPMHEDVFNDLWPGLEWLLWRILLVLLSAFVIGPLAMALVTFGGKAILLSAVLAGAAAGAVTIVNFGRIPETENHLLMIESSRYLKNQILIEYYNDHGMATDAAAFEEHQAKLRSWLLERMQGVMEQEFEEYNSRPYQRYSLVALMNVYDYAKDPAMSLREAAQMVLDRQLAKFAVSSSEGRRFAPFRRQMDRVTNKFDKLEDAANPPYDKHGVHVADLTDSDFPASLAQVYFGHTEHLVEHRVHIESTGSLIHSAASSYRPPAMLIDLAVNSGGGLEPDGSDGIWQHTFRHAGYERYVRGRHFLMTAGGVQTGFANQFEVVGIPFPYAGMDEDRGAAFPTTLMIDGAQQQSDGTTAPRDQLQSMLRVQGERINHGAFYTYDKNLCLWKGFACGKDIHMPASMWACAVSGPQRNGAKWWFFDSGACTGYSVTHRVFVVVVASIAAPTQFAPGAGVALGDGFFEVADAADVGNDFEGFQAKLLAENQNIGYARGVYHSARNEAIGWDFAFDGIRTVDGVAMPAPSDWQEGVDGNVMSEPKPGRVEIVNRRMNKRLVLDFFLPSAPKRWEL